MKYCFRQSILGCCIAGVFLQGVESQAAPMVRVTQKESQLELQRQQVRRWLVESPQIDLGLIAKKGSGWFVAEIQPSYLGSPVVEERGFTKNGVSYAVPNSQTKPLFKGKYTVVAPFGNVPQTDGSYRMESNFPHARMGPHQAYYGVDAEPLLWGGAALMRVNGKPNQLILPVIAIPKEWASDIKTAVEKRQQDSTQGQLEGKTVDQLLEMLPLASPVESFPILQKLLPQISKTDEKQRDAIREILLKAGGLKRAVWITQIIENQSAAGFKKPSEANLNPIFDKEMAEKIAADVPIEDAVSLLAALEVAGIRGDVRGNVSDVPTFGYDLLRALAAQTRFQTPPNQQPSDEQIQIRTLLHEMGVSNSVASATKVNP